MIIKKILHLRSYLQKIINGWDKWVNMKKIVIFGMSGEKMYFQPYNLVNEAADNKSLCKYCLIKRTKKGKI